MSAELGLYPWQKADWQRFEQFKQRMPHAVLVSGTRGVGKLAFALNVAKSILCEQKSACGSCNNCTLFSSGNHPDLHLIFTELLTLTLPEKFQAYAGRYLEDFEKAKKRKPRRIISVDQIRDLINNASLSHHSATHKVTIIAPAEQMNINASNALLKLLEEPPSDTMLVLVSSAPEQLAATIKSRCVPFVINVPERANALSWLEQSRQDVEHSVLNSALNLAVGAPLAALSVIAEGHLNNFDSMLGQLEALVFGKENPIAVSDQLAKLLDGRRLINWLQSIVKEILLVAKLDTHSSSNILSKHKGLQLALNAVPSGKLFGFYDELSEYKHHDIEQLNQQLLIEQLVLKLSVICGR